MEALSPYLLALVLLPLSLYLISFMGKKSSDQRLPPGSTGWPVLGESLEFGASNQIFIKERMEKYSRDVFRSSIMGQNIAVICGAHGNKFLFSNENKLLKTWWPKSVMKVIFFPQYVDSDLNEATAVVRSFKHDILKPEALKHYIPMMDELARENLDRYWTPNSVVKVFPLVKKFTFNLACKIFMNLVDPEDIKSLADPFGDALKGFFCVPVDFPGTTFNRAMKSGKLLRAALLKIIRRRRKKIMENVKGTEEYQDLLSNLVRFKDKNGNSLNDMEISNNIIGFLVASFDTTSSAVSSVIRCLAEFPHVYNEVLREQMAIAKAKGPDELLTWEDIDKMKYSWNMARETLRVIPAAQGGFKETLYESIYAGFTIPKGWKLIWNVHTTHKDPKYFPEPEKFDPTRFEGSGPTPHSFVPFGGGPGMCPGREYARLEILVFMHHVVKRFKLQTTIPDEKVVYHAAAIPVHGVPLRISPHAK